MSNPEVVVIGGGPAGLQAALTLARGQRRAVVLDAGPPRNARAHHVNNFVTRDGTPPATMRAIAREELAASASPSRTPASRASTANVARSGCASRAAARSAPAG